MNKAFNKGSIPMIKTGNRYTIKYEYAGEVYEHFLSSDCGYTDYVAATDYVLEYAEYTYGGPIELVAVEEYENDE